jgi:hypothetical protein
VGTGRGWGGTGWGPGGDRAETGVGTGVGMLGYHVRSYLRCDSDAILTGGTRPNAHGMLEYHVRSYLRCDSDAILTGGTRPNAHA